MNHFLIVLIAFVVVVKASLTVESQWLQFKFRHGKSYKNQVEEEARYKIFRNNLRKIEEHNKKFEQGLSTFQMGVTAFADLTEDEFKDKMGLRQNLFDFNTKNNIYKVPKEQLLANSLDWREKGAVTDIKDQQNCGSCWAFSVTGALEGQYQIKHKELIPLSEQNLIDCTGDYGNQGCKGGKMTWTFQYVKEHGITTEEKYPYVAKMEECRYNESDSILKISGYTSISKKDESALMSALSKIGPIAVAMDASMSLQLYTKGVFDDPQCSSVMLNHAVLLVGYGQEEIGNKTVEYWILKNEWGLFWGEDGYFRLVRGKNACGIATEASYPNIL